MQRHNTRPYPPPPPPLPSPPSPPAGWLLGSSPANDSGLLGSSPGSRRASPRHGSLLGRCVRVWGGALGGGFRGKRSPAGGVHVCQR